MPETDRSQSLPHSLTERARSLLRCATKKADDWFDRHQFWRDTVNLDLLYILGRSVNEENGIEYVRCACFVHGDYFGIQEMKASRLGEIDITQRPGYPFPTRFQQLRKLKTLWYLIRHYRSIRKLK